MRGLPRTRVSLPATYPRKRGPRAWHTGVRQTAQRLGDRGRTSSRATQRHQPLARRTSLRPPVGTSARRGRTAQCLIISGERGTVALRHEARCTCQCCPGLLSARPMGGRCLCCCGMPHGCDWPAPRRVSSARRSDSGQRNSPGLNAQPGAPARAGARHGACNASECSPRLAQMRPSSQPTVHRLLKKHCDECGTGDAWQAGHDAVIGCCVPSE